MEDTAWKKRLIEAMQLRKTSARALSLAIGRSEGYVHGILKEGKEPSLEKFLLIAEKLEVSLTWLVYGFEMSADAEALMRLYSGLSAEQKRDFLRMAESVSRLAGQSD